MSGHRGAHTMTDRGITPLCAVCGAPVPGVAGDRALRCQACFDTYLRSVDAGFLEHYAEFGAKQRRVVAETCMRGLVLADAGDRKLLGMAIYEQFVGAATDLIALTASLRARQIVPIARTFLNFELDPATASRFFSDLSGLSGVELLAALGLPPPETPHPALPSKIQKDVTRALREAVADFERLRAYRDMGEKALLLAADHFSSGVAVTDKTGYLAGRELTPGQVASVAIDLRRGRLDIAALRVDETRLSQVIDAIDVITRLSRALTYAFVTVHSQNAFLTGFSNAPRVRAG